MFTDTTVINLYYEADNVSVRGASGTAGSTYKDYSMPSGKVWKIEKFGGSASIEQTEIELLYSEDNGSTFVNPYDSTTTKIRCIHLQNGSLSETDINLIFEGATSTILRILVKNYNTVNEAEISGFIKGQKT